MNFFKFAAAQESPAFDDKPQTIDVDTGSILQRIDGWVDGAVRSIPNIAVAFVVIVLAIFIGIALGNFARTRLEKRGRNDLGRMVGGMLKWAIIIFMCLIAATIVVPTLKPGDLIAGLGVSSVAIGFAFKDILQNWLAGLLILLRQPFEIGDQISASGFEGTVETIETRSTIIKTYDGKRAVIPNSEIYTDAVLVMTAHEKIRDQYDIGIGYGDSMMGAIALLQEMLESTEEVLSDPAPEILVWDMAASWVTLRMRWWTDSQRSSVVHARSSVLKGVKATLDGAGIDMPYETIVNLIHDQTEEFDGIPSKQREGWTPRPNEKTRARWQVRGQGEDDEDLDVADKPKIAGKDRET